jgi:hypothetical protein
MGTMGTLALKIGFYKRGQNWGNRSLKTNIIEDNF